MNQAHAPVSCANSSSHHRKCPLVSILSSHSRCSAIHAYIFIVEGKNRRLRKSRLRSQ